MLDRLKSLFSGREPLSEADHRQGLDELHLATACLLVEIASLDNAFDDSERAAITRLLQRRFELPRETAERLIAAAETEVRQTHQLFSFTRVVKDRFDHEERIELMEMLWEVAYADGELHDYEANLMRRAAGLIFVSDRDNGEARKRALTRLGLEG
jgi:uncharacterized tellurite resistance protein B-like protein